MSNCPVPPDSYTQKGWLMNELKNVKSFKKGGNFSLYLITGIVSSVLFLAFCAMKQIYPFGERMINDVDLMEQSLPIYYHVWDALHGRAALTYDWNFALGMNFTGVFAHFSIINPFTLLFFLTPRRYLQKFIVFYVTFKIACTGVSMCVFLLHDKLLIRRRLPAPYIIIASVGYALSGYAIQYFGYSWIEVSFFAPLVMLMLNNMLLERDSLRITGYDLGYTAFLAMILAMNIPIAFPVCLYLLFYAAGYCLICIKDRTETTRIAFKFVVLSLLALGVSAVVFYPSFHELLQSYRIAIAQTFGVKEYFETLDDRGMEPWRKYFMMKTLVLPLLIEAACLIFKAVKKLFHRQDSFLLYINLVIIAPVYFETTNHVWHNGGYVCFPMRYGFMLIFTVIAGSYALLSEILTEQGLFTELSEKKLTVASYVLMLLWLGIICVLDPGELGFWAREEDAVVLSDRIGEIVPAPEVKIERMKNADASLHNSYSMIFGRPAFGNYIPLTTSDHIIADDILGYSQDWERMSDAGGTLFSDTLLQLNTTICKEKSAKTWLTDHTGSDLYEYKGSLDQFEVYERTTKYPYVLFVKDLEGKSLSWELQGNTYVNQNVLSQLFFDEDLFTDYEEDFSISGGEKKIFRIDVTGKQAVYVYTDDLTELSVSLNDENIMRHYPVYTYNGVIPLGLYLLLGKAATVRCKTENTRYAIKITCGALLVFCLILVNERGEN